jgi:3-oxoacyl-[acyl-carrier protein] reductase
MDAISYYERRLDIMKLSFEDKIILVTGATKGIGKQIANDLHNLGGTVLITGTKPWQIDDFNEETKKTGNRKHYFCVNFTSDESIENFLSELKRFPKIDVLVNNAGINKHDSVENIITEEWNDMMAVNVTAPFKLIRDISPRMIKHAYGRIINIASIFSKIGKERRTSYTTTKFGVDGLTVGVSNYLSRYNILVNTVSPGFIMTDMTRTNLSPTEIKQLTQQIPAKRMGEVEDISRAVAFLASDLNSYITGHNIVVDGGFVNV